MIPLAPEEIKGYNDLKQAGEKNLKTIKLLATSGAEKAPFVGIL